ncbi:MAG: DUF6455 family protein [Gammaproteobacteria bacterium]|jgi:hypothetical protein|nr:DUF6455 family protein [Gammaproteobacteria bacterium]
MNIITNIVAGILLLFITVFLLRLAYTIFMNLKNGRKFYDSLDQEFKKLRLNSMLGALGIDKTAYLYQTRVKDIQRHMNNCSACENTDECDEKLSSADLDVTRIEFCNNESELKEIKQQIQQH